MTTLNTTDCATAFLINETNMRGSLVRLNTSLNDILSQHDYPQAVSQALGEALILVSMFGENLKFDGIITLQIKSDGPIALLIADYMGGGNIRGYAELNQEQYEALAADHGFDQLLGEGYFAITLDQGADMERYQGIVALEGNSISALAEAYFRQSEQLDTLFNIKIGQQLVGNQMQWCGGGIMLQRLPDEAHAFDSNEKWETAQLFLDTLSSAELIDPLVTAETLLHRLFHEDGVWVYPSKPLQHQCRCSRERIQHFVENMSAEERDEMMVDDEIIVTCQFCNKQEVFTERDF